MGNCVEGRQVCAENLGLTGPDPDCSYNLGSPRMVPRKLCQDTSDCILEDDPIECIADAAETKVDCEVHVRIGADGAPLLCDNREVELAVPEVPGAVDCFGYLHGGLMQEQYNVGLIDVTQPTAGVDLLNGTCVINFKVGNPRGNLPPRSDRILVSVGASDAPRLVAITLRPKLVDECGAAGLVCSGLPIVLTPP
jgi:hypothetical protein